MNETCRLLARWKKHRGIESDAEAARELGVSRNAITQWRHRGSQASAALVVRMCADLGEDLGDCLMRIAGDAHAA